MSNSSPVKLWMNAHGWAKQYKWPDDSRVFRTKGEVVSAIYQTKYSGTIPVLNKGLMNNVSEITGVHRIGALPTVRLIKGRKSPIISPTKDPQQVVRWVFKVDKPKATVVAFKSGALQVTTKEDIDKVRAFLDRTYFPGVTGFKSNKIDGQFFLSFNFSLEKLVNAFPSITIYSPELEPFARMKIGDFQYKVFIKGLVQTSKGDPEEAAEAFMKTLKTKSWQEFAKVQRNVGLAAGKEWNGTKVRLEYKNSPTRSRPNRKMEKLNVRYKKAQGYNDVKEGFYVRPGPNGVARFYPIPTNKAPIRMKVLRAYTNAGVNIPNSVKKLFNLEGLELKEKEESKAAPSFSATKAGYYVKPGKAGAPFFYKVPKDTKAAKPRVVKAYKNAGKSVPQAVRNIFGINNNNMAVKENNLYVYVPHRVNRVNNKYRINGVLATNYTIPQLVGIARNLKIARASNKMSVAQLTELIVSRLGVNKKPHAVVNGVPHTLLLNGRVMRGTRAKKWEALTRPEKDAIAKAILSQTNLEGWKGLSVTEQFQALLAMASKSPTPPPAPKAPKVPTPRSVSSSVSSANSYMKELEQQMLEGQKENYKKFIKNSFGKYQHLVTNQDAKNLEKLINSLPRGKRGDKPLQVNVDRVKLHFLKELKAKRQLEDIRKRYRNAIVVPSNLKVILKNRVNEYKNILTNIGTRVNKKGKLPKQANVKRGIIAWVRNKFPRKLRALAPREVENMITGEKRIVYPSPPSPNRKTPNIPKLSVNRLSPLKVQRRSPAYKRPRKPKKLNPVYSPKSLVNIKTTMNYYGLNAARNGGWTVQEFIDAVRRRNNKVSANDLKNIWNAQVVAKHPYTGGGGRIKR